MTQGQVGVRPAGAEQQNAVEDLFKLLRECRTTSPTAWWCCGPG